MKKLLIFLLFILITSCVSIKNTSIRSQTPFPAEVPITRGEVLITIVAIVGITLFYIPNVQK